MSLTSFVLILFEVRYFGSHIPNEAYLKSSKPEDKLVAGTGFEPVTFRL
jgi:hypothetical protein